MLELIIPGTGHSMFINPHDQKGRSLIMRKGLSQPRVVRFWQRAAALYHPTLIIDGGVNYGEILLSAAYPPHTEIIAIDANQELAPYVKRSLAKHPNGKQVKLVHGFVSDVVSPDTVFYIDILRSGNSSGFPLGDRASRRIQVPSLTIDSLLDGRTLDRDVLLFKLDVEGFEWNALSGMSRMLNHCKSSIGCIEFNMAYLRSKGIDLDAFLDFLHARFLIFAPDEQGSLTRLRPPLLSSAAAFFEQDKGCNDIMLFSHEELYEKWTCD
ncbi:FkbM family methyltransferase [Paenibacillus sp. HB172176]|uniref:FkbM family methyltransferase n=1 Tax=Paenibacillus sp. HB172176 TaxID=2493690 RepID=UPI001439A302|nr:FkbM family methyltransferase [Paenibacillus sp. HB172176]